MTARGVVISAALHLALGVMLAVAGSRARRPSTVDIALVAPTLELAEAGRVPPPPPARDPAGGAPGAPSLERVPARRMEPARNPPHTQRRAPPPAHPAIPEPVAAPGGDLARGEPAPDTTPGTTEAGAGAGEGESGSGAGSGPGGDGGDGARDLSSRPVPLDTVASQELPYTEEAARDRISGDVQLALMIDPLGRVANATVRRGLGHGLDEVATRIAMKIRFRPARDRTGKPIAGTVRWRFHFQAP